MIAHNHQGEATVFGQIGVLASGQTVVDVRVAELWHVTHSHPKYQPIPKTASIIEDMTFTIAQQAALGEVMALIKQTSPLIKSITLQSEYQHNYTFRIEYHDPTANLNGQAVEPIRKQIVASLATKIGAQLVGNV